MSETRPHVQYPPTLCWDCANATGGCRWSSMLKPVKGWKIVPTKKRIQGNKLSHSCIVLECPEFKRDSLRCGLVRYKEPEEKQD